MLDRPKLEILAREIITVGEGKGKDFSQLVEKIRKDEYPRADLVIELVKAGLSFFAKKLDSGYYEIQNTIEEIENGKTDN